MKVMMQNFYISIEKAVLEVAFDPPASGEGLLSVHQPQGIYYDLGGHRVGLFVAEEKLFLFLNGLASEVGGQEVTASLRRDGEHRQLKMTMGGSVTTIDYIPGSPISTPFHTDDEEDADFGLWLTNVLNSDLRRNIFLQSRRAT